MKIRLLWVAPALALYAQTFRDPAPPVAQTLASVQPPAARANPAVHFHTKPKPLPAVVQTNRTIAVDPSSPAGDHLRPDVDSHPAIPEQIELVPPGRQFRLTHNRTRNAVVSLLTVDTTTSATSQA